MNDAATPDPQQDRSAKPESSENLPPRRPFLIRMAAVVIGAVVSLGPLFVGLGVLLDPLRKRSKDEETEGDSDFVPVTNLSSLPDDGLPRRFQVNSSRWDAWNFHDKVPVGAIYLRREPDNDQVEALHATCPHLGCMVGFSESTGIFRCPCHESSFHPDGSLVEGVTNVSPRPMDPLEVKISESGVVLVKYMDFHAGREKPEPKV